MEKIVSCLVLAAVAALSGAALAAAPIIVWPKGDTVATLTPTQAQYLSWSSAERYAKFTDPTYRNFVADTAVGASRPQPQTFRWTGGSGVSTVTVTRASDSKVVFTTNQVAGASVTIDNFEIGQSYKWTVSNAGGTATATFTTERNAPRLLRDPDPQGRITGVRDLGGRYGLDGRRVRQNKIFRSSRFNASSGSYITDANRSFWQDELGIKSDLDLRSDSETYGITESPLGANINYFFRPGSSYDGMFTAEGIAMFKAEFAPFLNEQNYPIVFHCVSGQDRTGCLAYILNGVLGVREAELEKDYEATVFWNPDIPNFGFGHRDFDRFRAGLAAYPGADVNAQCCYYVTNVCGFTSAQLTTLRDIMLEPFAEHTHTYGEWFVTANPTATAAGAKCRYCTVCDIAETAAIPAPASIRDYLQLSAAGTLTTDYAPDADCRVLATYAASPGGKRTVALTATRSGNVTSIALEAGKCYKVEIVRRDRDGEWRAVRAFVPAANGATATFYDAGKGTYASVQTSGTATLGDDGFASTDASFSLYHTSAGVAVVFTNGMASTLTVRGNYNLKRALVVGGGGAGGYKLGGGGGAGEMVEVTLATPIAYAAGDTIALTVGAGGLSAKDPGGNGGVSSVTLGTTTYRANGGGGGGDFDWDDTSVIKGRAGGSGGGGGGSSGSANAGGAASKLGSGYGYAGGSSLKGSKTGGGGGGGAYAAGGTSTATKGGAGAAGRANDITGTSRYYAAGGAGGSTNQVAQGGSSIGGTGGSGNSSGDYTLPTAGAVGTGSGGGGGGYNLSGADGGSGTVILYFEPIVTQVTKPTLAQTTAVYDGADHKPTIAVTPAGAYTVTYSAEQWIEVGTYTATCTLTDTTKYVWKDGSKDDVVLTFTITAAPPKPQELHVGTATDASAYEIETAADTYAVVFTNGVTSTLTLNGNYKLSRALVVGGGGAGGGRSGGGGGAGEMIEITPATSIEYSAGDVISLTVGAGGIGQSGQTAVGADGDDSSVTLGGTAYVANGGGGGGIYYSSDYDLAKGRAGGSGGGSARSSYAVGGSDKHVGGYGNVGGACAVKNCGGGGGGAGTPGSASDATAVVGGAGGAGRANDITGTSRYYAAGGGGGSKTYGQAAAGGSGIGGTGGTGTDSNFTEATAGLDGTGSGGGGAGNASWKSGANGGSGTVILLFTAYTPEPTPEPTVPPTIGWPKGDTVEILTPTQRQFLAWSADMRREMFSNETYRAFICDPANGWSNPQPQTFRWTGDGVCTVTVERVSDGRVHFRAVTTNNSVTVDNFEVNGSYRWTVANGLGSASAAFTTETGAPRLLHDPDPSRNIKGVRDLGGWIGLEGRRVRQNLLIRTSGLNRKTTAESTEVGESFITDANRAFWLDFLGIKSDLDFRSDEERKFLTASPLGPTVNFCPHELGSYDGMFTWGIKAFKEAFAELLVSNNYPIAFHCVAGQDRTGCFAYIVNGILGVAEDDLMKDWEATIFWNGAFPDPVTEGHKYIDTFRTNLSQYPGANDNERCCYYVTNVCGFTYAQLESFRAFMLEGYEPKPEPPPETFDWLETDGKGWLLTDYVPNPAKSGLATEVRFLNMVKDQNHGLFHASELVTGATSVAGDFWAATCYPGSWIEFYTRSTAGFESIQFAQGIDETNNYHTLVFAGNTARYDGVVTNADWTAKDVRVPGPLALFAGSYGKSLLAFPRLRCRGVKIWEVSGGVTNLVHDYVPARNPSGAATLWDRETRTFLTVQNGGVFTVGNDVVGPTVDGETVPFTQEAMNDQTRINTSKTIVFPSAEGLSVSGTSVTYGGTTVTLRDYYLVSLDGARLVLALNPTNAVPTIGAVSETVPALAVEATEVKVGVPFANQREGLYYSLNGYGEVNAAEPTKFGTTAQALTVEQFGCEKPAPEKGFFRIGVTDVPPVQ